MLAVQARKQGLSLNDIALRFRLYNFIKKMGVNEDQLELFIANIHSTSEGDELPPVKIVDLTNQLFDISKSDSTPLVEVPGYIKQKLQDKQRIEEETKAAEEILQSKNVSVEAINENMNNVFIVAPSKIIDPLPDIQNLGETLSHPLN